MLEMKMSAEYRNLFDNDMQIVVSSLDQLTKFISIFLVPAIGLLPFCELTFSEVSKLIPPLSLRLLLGLTRIMLGLSLLLVVGLLVAGLLVLLRRKGSSLSLLLGLARVMLCLSLTLLLGLIVSRRMILLGLNWSSIVKRVRWW